MAKAGGGAHEFIQAGTLPNQSKIKRQFKRAMQPCLKDISVDWLTDNGTQTLSLAASISFLNPISLP